MSVQLLGLIENHQRVSKSVKIVLSFLCSVNRSQDEQCSHYCACTTDPSWCQFARISQDPVWSGWLDGRGRTHGNCNPDVSVSCMEPANERAYLSSSHWRNCALTPRQLPPIGCHFLIGILAGEYRVVLSTKVTMAGFRFRKSCIH